MSKATKVIMYGLGGFLVISGLLLLLVYPVFGIICIIGVAIICYAAKRPHRLNVSSEFVELNELPSRYVVLDTETTGLDPATCEILEVAAIRYSEGTEIDRFHSFVKPSGRVPSRITSLTGIKTSNVKNAPAPEEVAAKLSSFIGGEAVAGYNVQFDISFIQTRMGVSFPGGAYDVLRLARKTIHGTKNYKLQTLKEFLGLEISSHNAIADCETTQAVISFCQKKINELLEEQRFCEEAREKILSELASSPDGVRKVDLYLPYPDSKKPMLDRVINSLLEDNMIERGKVGSRIIFTLKSNK